MKSIDWYKKWVLANTEQFLPCSCLLWTGPINENGYGSVRPPEYGTKVKAHRFNYILHYGEISSNVFVLHKCNTPACVNIDHLKLGNYHDNMVDKVRSSHHWRTGPKRSLTDEQVESLRNDVKMGNRRVDLAIKYGISKDMVGQIARYEKYKRTQD